MIIMHVEDRDVTRGALADGLSVQDGRLGQYEYLSTGMVAAAKAKLRSGNVKLLILDLGLNTPWDNKNMIRVLRYLALDEEPEHPNAPRTCDAHAIATIAHQHQTQVVVLTNYLDYLGGNPPLSADKLRDVFHAQAIFNKDADSIVECARWVRKELSLG